MQEVCSSREILPQQAIGVRVAATFAITPEGFTSNENPSLPLKLPIRRQGLSTAGEFMLAGVMGWPISQSRSPVLHNYWLEKYQLNGWVAVA